MFYSIIVFNAVYFIADILVAEVDDKAVITYLSALYKALPTVPPYVRMQNEQVSMLFFGIH